MKSLWRYYNGENWKLADGKYSHRLGPDVEQVQMSADVYYAGVERETRKVKDGDFVLDGWTRWDNYNPSLTTTVFVNDTPLTTFAAIHRRLVITDLLKQGPNTIRLETRHVENSLHNNNTYIAVSGPAHYDVVKEAYTFRPVTWISAMTGWNRNKATSQLMNAVATDSKQLIRTVPLYLREVPGSASSPVRQPTEFVRVGRKWDGYENPLHTELRVNGELVSIFTSDTNEPIADVIKQESWNEIAVRTVAQYPTNDKNHLNFYLGVSQRDKNGKIGWSPLLWQFNNGQGWTLENRRLRHRLDPDIQEVTCKFQVYYGALGYECKKADKGDYVLVGYPRWDNYNPSVTATVEINGIMLSSFALTRRQVVITPFLKNGTNTIRLITKVVENCLETNDTLFEVRGPGEYSVANGKYEFPNIERFNALVGWQRDKSTGQLVPVADANADTFERVIEFELPDIPQR